MFSDNQDTISDYFANFFLFRFKYLPFYKIIQRYFTSSLYNSFRFYAS
jgi:hypothetical protein